MNAQQRQDLLCANIFINSRLYKFVEVLPKNILKNVIDVIFSEIESK